MSIVSIVCLAIGTALSVAFLVISLTANKKYEPLIENLDEDEHTLKSIYPVGFFVLDAVKYSFESERALKLRGECEVIYGSLYAEYYLRLNYAQKISSMLLLLPLGFLLYPILQSPIAFIVGLAAMGLAYWNYNMKITDEMKKREDEIARDLPDIYSKLTLLVNAGMILREAWERTSMTGDSTIYLEMRNAVLEMQNGVSETQAIIAFGQRCMSSNVKKFASTLAQNVTKGNKELTEFLRKQSAMGWEEKKQYARQKGEEASSKLTIPSAGMMIGVMIMIVVPMFGNMSFGG